MNTIKRAIREYYTEAEWLIIMLKNSWAREGDPRISLRDSLVLHDYLTVELNVYNRDPVVYVYVGASPSVFKRPFWMSAHIKHDMSYGEVKIHINELLDAAYANIAKISTDSITVDAVDVSNQLAD